MVAAYNQKVSELEKTIEKQNIANLEASKQALSRINYQQEKLESLQMA